MIIKRSLGEKGQVVIPKDIREFLRLKMGSTIIFEIRNDAVVLKQEEKEDALDKFLTVSRKKGLQITLKEIKELEDESYDLP